MTTKLCMDFWRRHLFSKLQLLETLATKMSTLNLGRESLPIHLKTASPDCPAASRDTMSTKLRSPDLQTMLRDHIPISQPETLATCRESFQVLHRASRRCLPWIVTPLFVGYTIILIRYGRIFEEVQFLAPIQPKNSCDSFHTYGNGHGYGNGDMRNGQEPKGLW